MSLLSDAMALNNTLTELDVSDCGFRSVALMALRAALQSNCTLLKLQTHTNRVTKDAQELAHAEVEANNFVRSIARNRGTVNAKKMRLTVSESMTTAVELITDKLMN